MNPQTRATHLLTGILVIVVTVGAFFLNLIQYLLPFYVALAHLILGWRVYLQDRENEVNLSFCWLAISIAFWDFCAFMVWDSRVSGLIFWDKFIFFWAPLIPVCFLYFAFLFPKPQRNYSIKEKLSWFVIPAFFLILFPTDLLIRDAILTGSGRQPVYGPLYWPFAVYFLSYIIYGLLILWSKYRRSAGLTRTQIGYVFLGVFLTVIFAAFTSLLLPALGESRYFNWGPFFTLFIVGFTTYAIIRHRLMSVEVVMQRGAIYLFLAALITSVYIISLIISQNLLSGASGWFVVSLAALIIALTYQPLFRLLQQITDRIFFRGRYDYQQTLRHISQAIATQIKLEELSRLMVSTFVETMGVSEISFMVYDKDRKRFRSVQVDLPQAGASRYKLIELDEQSPIVSWLKKNQDILVLDEISAESALKDEVERLGVALWVPIISKEYLIGIITLGRKLSGDIYTYEDIGLLITLANQTALALENAALYGEVLAAKNYTQEILQSIAIGVLTVDGRGQLFTFNPMAENLTGMKITEVVGRPYTEVFSAKSSLNSLIEKTLAGRSVKNLETGIVSKSRGLVPVSVSTIPLVDPKGKRSGALISFIDLTEVKALENKVRQADKVKALGTLAAGMAHEIKNPLSSMKVISQLLPIKYQDEEFRKKMMEILPKEIDRIDRIVESLLGFARSTVPKIESISMEEILEDNLKYYGEQAEKNGVKIVRQYAALPQIQGDKDQLSQVFSNLILNAIQAMPEGGELKVQTREGKKTENILEAIKIDISDSGHGIPEENLKHLFDPFFTTKYAGTGLGLTITHSIIDGHRGYIDVKSEVGRGTAFTITLPVSQELL